MWLTSLFDMTVRHSRFAPLAVLLPALAAAPLAAAAPAPTYSIVEIKGFGLSGLGDIIGYGMNNKGDVVGSLTTEPSPGVQQTHAFRFNYDTRTVSVLDTLGGRFSQAAAVNNLRHDRGQSLRRWQQRLRGLLDSRRHRSSAWPLCKWHRRIAARYQPAGRDHDNRQLQQRSCHGSAHPGRSTDFARHAGWQSRAKGVASAIAVMWWASRGPPIRAMAATRMRFSISAATWKTSAHCLTARTVSRPR